MKGLTALFLGIFGTFAFSWAGLTLIPNARSGTSIRKSDEEGTDIYPVPKSGMAERGRKIYAANGCVYCHSQQVRADYAASDIERKWGTRRSAPRDYLFERPVLLGKMRMGPDLANIGKRAPAEDAESRAQPRRQPLTRRSRCVCFACRRAAAGCVASPAAAPQPTCVCFTCCRAEAPAAASPNAQPRRQHPPAPASTTAPAHLRIRRRPSTRARTERFRRNIPPPGTISHLYSPRSVLAGPIPTCRPINSFMKNGRVTGERSADALKLTGNDAPAGRVGSGAELRCEMPRRLPDVARSIACA